MPIKIVKEISNEIVIIKIWTINHNYCSCECQFSGDSSEPKEVKYWQKNPGCKYFRKNRKSKLHVDHPIYYRLPKCIKTFGLPEKK